jgi:hypothetical protein
MVLAAWMCSARAVDATTTDRQTSIVALPPDRALSLHVTVGNVRIQGERRADAVIEASRSAPTPEGLAQIPIEIEQTPSDVRVISIQRGGGTDARFRTDFMLRVPHGARLSAVRIMEGRLTLEQFAGIIDADVRHGSIEASHVQGTLRFETGIGDVIATQARLSSGGLLRLRAFNGDVRLTLAERPVNARVQALALNGSIESDIPLQMKDTWGPRWGEATLGAGDPVISIDVVTGRILIRLQPPAGR